MTQYYKIEQNLNVFHFIWISTIIILLIRRQAFIISEKHLKLFIKILGCGVAVGCDEIEVWAEPIVKGQICILWIWSSVDGQQTNANLEEILEACYLPRHTTSSSWPQLNWESVAATSSLAY